MGREFGTDRSGEASGRSVRAAQYARMSTEHQKYSTENQAEAMQQYAARRGIEIVRTYADAGKSGLSLDGRDGLKQLIEDVQNKTTDFTTILVYDISRWGRFQDADESAYYEYICKRAGISVQYCAEQFENDGSPVSTIVKGVKRAMAGEYSRELSVKVFTGQCRLIELGFRQGGPAGYGLRRRLIDQAGATKNELTRGEHKSIQTDRVVLIPGPPDASVHDSRKFDGLLNKANTSADVYADSAYRSAAIEAKLRARGLRSRIHQRASRNHALSKAQENANHQKSKVRVRIEHVFGAQQTSLGGRIVRTIGIVRAKAKIGLQNLTYNIRRLVTLERMAAA